MSFSLSPEQTRLISETRAIARNHLKAVAARGQPGRVNRPLVAALAEHGLLGRIFPSRTGVTAGPRISALELCLLREALACESTEAETAFALQGLGAHPIVEAGTPDLVEKWVGPVARGRAIAAFALSEPEAGSDAGALSLVAAKEGKGFRLRGTKTWISNAPEADVYTVFARTTPGAGAGGVSAFVVSRDSDGLTGESLEMVAPHPVGRLHFDGVFVPDEHLLGEVDGGFAVAMKTLDLFRPSVGAFAVGMATAALEVAIEHARRRTAFGHPLREFQAVSHRLAEMATRTHAARLVVYEAAVAYDQGMPGVARRSAMAKLLATETAQQVVDAAIQVHGAAALQKGHVLEHLYREVRAPRIYEGTSEIQREIIARDLFDASD